MAGAWRVAASLLALLVTGAVAEEVSRSPCSCQDPALLQVGAAAESPRNCNCVGGAWRHAVTPHDELVGMGMGALNNHLWSCKRKLDGLQQERDYAVAAGATQAEKAEDNVKLLTKGLAKMKNASAQDRQKATADKQKLQNTIKAAQLNLTKLKQVYNQEFSLWFDLKNEMARKLVTVKKCKCAQKVSSFLQQLRGGRVLQHLYADDFDSAEADAGEQAPAQDNTPAVHAKVREVEACEANVVRIATETEAAQAKAAKSVAAASGKLMVLKKRMFDHQQVDKLFSQTSRLKALRESARTLTAAVAREEQQVEGYKKKVGDLRFSLKKLSKEMETCKC